MKKLDCTFPFGRPVRPVVQAADGLKKRAFIIAIYSSAVHARWIGQDGLTKVSALAVENEPHIFWEGGKTDHLIPTIDKQFGRLEPASPGNNGPSGRALDLKYLKPLGLTRDQSWLADMVPHTLSNRGQQTPIARFYEPIVRSSKLPASTVRLVPTNVAAWRTLVDIGRLLGELKASGADTIVTIGDAVIRHFLNRVSTTPFPLLGKHVYGEPKQVVIDGGNFRVVCLAHMRVTQIRPIEVWRAIHDHWIEGRPEL